MSAVNGEIDNYYNYLWFIENSVVGLEKSIVLDKIGNVNYNRKSNSKR